jgi:hypothetical protein
MSGAWLLCSYKLPRQPSRLRLAVWRRLRRLGAVMLHDGLWTLPADAKTREDFDWVAEEIEERGGRAMLWESRSLDPAQDAAIAALFRAEADERYAGLGEAAAQLARVARRRTLPRASLEQAAQRLRTLDRSLRLERRRDYFRAPGRAAAEAGIQAAMEVVRSRGGTRKNSGRLRAVGD